MSNQRFLKFAGGFLAIIIAALGVWYATLTLNPEAREQRRALEELKAVEEQYKNDTFGGETPEETLELFLAALEDENIELASKYFLPDEQTIRKKELREFQKEELLNELIRRLNLLNRGNRYPLVEGKDDYFIYEAINTNGDLILQVSIARIPAGVWKITDL